MFAQALKGHLDTLILAVVAGGPAHGYAIVEALKQRSQGTFSLPEGTIYPALHRLEGAGLLASHWMSEQGRRRRVYQLTAKGGRRLDVLQNEWSTFSRAVAGVLA